MPLRIWLEYLVIIAGFTSFTWLTWVWELPLIAGGMGVIVVGAVVMLVRDLRRQWR